MNNDFIPSKIFAENRAILHFYVTTFRKLLMFTKRGADFDADPNPTFHIDANPDPDPHPIPSFTLLVNLNFFKLLFTVVDLVHIVYSFSSVSQDGMLKFSRQKYGSMLQHYIGLKQIRIRIRQNDADLTGTGYTTLTETNIKRTLAGAKP
jgi:hypothetical protein